MSIICEFRVRSSELAMFETLSRFPNIELNLVQEAGTDPSRPQLHFWVSGVDIESFDQQLHDDETVTDIERYSELPNRVLYRLQVTDAVDVVSYPMWVEIGAEQMDARYTSGWWENRMRVPDRDALGVIEQWCEENDVNFELQAVYTSDETVADTTLTESQREVLQVALEVGYFGVPRQGTLSDVATELDISTQAVSEHIRRGHRRFLEQHL